MPARRTKILFLTDSHVGGSDEGFHHQPRQCHRLAAVFARLSQLVTEVRPDIVLHGGDITEHGTDAEMVAAFDMLAGLGAPVALCLGNHDLGQENGLGRWQRQAAQRGLACGDALIGIAGIDIILMNTAWITDEGAGHRWKAGDDVCETISAEQLRWLSDRLLERAPTPTILVVHSPLTSIPPRLTGGSVPVHVPAADYSTALLHVLRRHPHVRLVLAGHNHVNCLDRDGSCLLTSTAAFSEMPGCVRLVETDGVAWSMRTISLLDPLIDGALDPALMWVLGSAGDRSVDW